MRKITMIKYIQYLVENKELLTLLKENKLSLVNVTPMEQQAIVEAFKNDSKVQNIGWR